MAVHKMCMMDSAAPLPEKCDRKTMPLEARLHNWLVRSCDVGRAWSGHSSSSFRDNGPAGKPALAMVWSMEPFRDLLGLWERLRILVCTWLRTIALQGFVPNNAMVSLKRMSIMIQLNAWGVPGHITRFCVNIKYLPTKITLNIENTRFHNVGLTFVF